MKHPSESDLALYATGDLNWARQKWTGRHVSQCGACQSIVVGYSEFRTRTREFPALPAGMQWNRLAAEMSANIRLGLEAGECVSPRFAARPAPRPRFGLFTSPPAWNRLGIAAAALLMIAGIGFIVEHPPSINAPAVTGTVLEASESGLQISEGSQTLRLLNTSGTEVSRTVGARGEVGARYMDPNGYVTVSRVYGD